MTRTSSAQQTAGRWRSRSRLALWSAALAAALFGSLAGVSHSSAALGGSGRVSAHLTKTNFSAAQAAKVKLVYSFSSESRRFAYLITRKDRAKWVKVRSVAKQGSFTGSHRMTVNRLFKPKPVRAGTYRIKVSATANTVTLRFAVTAAPRSGNWVATSLTGPVSGSGGGGSVEATSVSFNVPPSQAAVSQFGFGFSYSGFAKPGQSCSGSGFSSINAQTTSPIKGGRFSSPSMTGSWSGAASGSFNGRFDSPTKAHGTATMQVFVSGAGCFTSGSSQTGTFHWRATRKSS